MNRRMLLEQIREKLDTHYTESIPDLRSGFDSNSADAARPAVGADMEGLHWSLEDLDTFAQEILQRQNLILEGMAILLGEEGGDGK